LILSDSLTAQVLLLTFFLYAIILKSYTNPTTTRHFAETHRDICISAQRAMHLCHET